MDRKIILFELNEVPLRIVDAYCRWHPESALARRLPECFQYETYCENVGHLSPWNTWPTFHRGVVNDRHLIADFGQDLSGADEAFPPLWTLLARGGVRTGVFGSLHTYPMPRDLENFEFFLPDTFAAGAECFPNSIELFQKFNLTMARESARNVSTKLPWRDALRLLRSAPDLGLRVRTFLDVGRQLVDERVKSWKKSRRRTYQAVLAFDIFMRNLERTRPAFSTFFTNHVASAQHRFWAAAFPGDYEKFGFDAQWVDTYAHEIEFAMNKFDAFFARLVAFADRNPEYVVWVATSMGQEAIETSPLETQLYLTEAGKFTAALGLDPADWEPRPAMLPQWNVLVRPGKAGIFRDALGGVEIDGRPLGFREAAGGFFSLDFGHQNLFDKPQQAKVGGRAVPFADLGLKNVEIEDKSNASAYHIPQGTLLIYDPTRREVKRVARTQVPVTEIAPTILRNFAVPVPAYMAKPARLGA